MITDMRYFTLLVLLISTFALKAQQSLTVEQCEELFQKNNLQLVAQKFNVDAQKALVIQAKIWDLPYVTAEVNAYNPNDHSYFNVGKDGQKALAIEQLIVLGNRRRNEVKIANLNADIAGYQLEDLLRNLGYQLKESFYTLYFLESQLAATSAQMDNVGLLVDEYKVQVDKGNITMKDLVRLEALYFGLRNDKNELQNSILATQTQLKLITGTNADIIPLANTKIEDYYYAKSIDSLNVDTLVSMAVSKRPDFQISVLNKNIADQNVRLQKSLNMPDVTLGGNYNQRGGVYQNEINLTLGIPLPLWNKNKGNIRMAKSISQEQTYLQQFSQNQLTEEVHTAVQKYKNAYESYNYLINSKSGNFTEVYNGVTTNFAKRNISILEYTDFMESYNHSIQEFNQIRLNFILSGENLNTTINSKIF